MMTKQKSLFILISVPIVVAVAIASYFFLSHRSDAYLAVLPQDAKALLKLDFKELVEEADLTLDEQRQLLKKISSDEKADLGIDIKRPIYAFVTGQGTFGAVAAVDDADDLEARCADLAKKGRAGEVMRQRGYSWVVVKQQWLFAFDDSRALLMGPAVGSAQDALRTEMANLLSQSRKESGVQSKLYQSLDEKDVPLAAVVDAGVLPESIRQQASQLLNLRELDDVQLQMAFELDDNEMKLEAEFVTENPDAVAHLKEINQLFRPVQGDLVKQSHAGTVAWVCANLDGERLIELLRKQPEMRTALIAMNTAVDADMMLKSIDGDVALDFDERALQLLLGWGRELPVMLTAQVGNTDFLKQSDYWLQSARGNTLYELSATSDTDFLLRTSGKTYGFGVHDHILYVNTDPDMGTSADHHAANPWLEEHRKDIKGHRIYATVNLEAFLTPFRAFLDGYKGVLASCQRIVFEMEDAGEFEIRLIAPEDTNIAKSILQNLHP